MKILHTSDWHIGRTLYRQKRYDEFESFLSWLVDIISREEVDALVVAGDVFDISTPGTRAQELYYQFLCRVATSSCRHVVIIGGNHDSPSFLNAPRELLRTLNVHVIGSATEKSEDEVLVLKNKDGSPEIIVCAIPYLRDRDIRAAEAGESIEDKERKLLEGIRTHYFNVCGIAEQKRRELGIAIPVIATGHLFAAGGHTVEGDGVRDLYVGSIAHVTADIFPDCIDYHALGHLHVPQTVNGSEVMRYSGSPLPMGFGESRQEKSLCLVEFLNGNVAVKLIKVPLFQRLERIRGNCEEITARIFELSTDGSNAWLEIVYEGKEIIGDLRELLEAAISGTNMTILRIKNNRVMDMALNQIHNEETLDDLNVNDVFRRCMAVNDVPAEQQEELLHAYQEAVTSLDEEDLRAE